MPEEQRSTKPDEETIDKMSLDADKNGREDDIEGDAEKSKSNAPEQIQQDKIGGSDLGPPAH